MARRVIVHGGSYELRATFLLGREDSGSAEARVVWQAAPGDTGEGRGPLPGAGRGSIRKRQQMKLPMSEND